MLNIFKLERRYSVFDEKTYNHLIKLLNTMTTYTMDSPTRTKLTDIYYDNQKNLVEENGLLLRRRVYKNKAELKIKRRYFAPEYYYSDSLRSHEREREIGLHDSLSQHYFFLNNALMFGNPFFRRFMSNTVTPITSAAYIGYEHNAPNNTFCIW